MGRVNFNLLARQQRQIASNVGETAIWLQYVSSNSVGTTAAAFGEYGAWNHNRFVVTGLFQAATYPENLVPGGIVVDGDVMATFVDMIPSPNDRVVWRGTVYRVASDPIPQQVLSRSAYRFVMRRGDAATG